MTVLAPTRLFTGDAIVEGASVHVRDGRIAAVTREPASDAIKLDGLLAPGFIDAQVNGGGGVLFNDAPSAATLATIAAAHRRFGVTGFMATLISDAREKIAQAIHAVDEAVKSGIAGVVGLHLEGPWLFEGRRGAHPAKHLRRFDQRDLELLTRPRAFPLMVTVAPEQIDTASVTALADAGVIVSLGHTGASSEEIEAALKAGARGFTHLFNAMPAMTGRAPGPVGAALAAKDSWAGMILDGIHVHRDSARAAFAAKGARKLMLVSDSMATVGASGTAMSLFGEQVTVRDGALRTREGTLAGAHLDMASAARNAMALLGATHEEALRMATLTPAEFLRIDHERGRIAQGCRADFVLLGSELDVLGVWIAGVQVR